MRSVWMVVSGFAMAVAIGGVVYYFLPRPPAEPDAGAFSVPPQPSTGNRVLVLPAGNPLLTADKSQFRQWMPPFCGADMFLQVNPQPHKVDVCVNGTISRIAEATGVTLARADVLDPRVKEHWREVMGAQ